MMSTVAGARSFLFVPGARPERFSKALASAADCIVLDLEDAVAPDQKAPARDSLAEGLDAVDALARAPQVAHLAFGHLDFPLDLGMRCVPEESELRPVRWAFSLDGKMVDAPVVRLARQTLAQAGAEPA